MYELLPTKDVAARRLQPSDAEILDGARGRVHGMGRLFFYKNDLQGYKAYRAE
jgi:hypothetical protein